MYNTLAFSDLDLSLQRKTSCRMSLPRNPRQGNMMLYSKAVYKYLAFSFLCTFVPGSEKSIERTFAPVELSFRGTFATREWKLQELSFHGTFAPLELSLLRSECSKNFRSIELSHPWNVCLLHKQLSCHLTFAPVELSLPYLKKLWKAGKQCFHRRILANVRCCLLVGLCVLWSTMLVQISE